MKVGERIREFRLAKGITQKELGDILGITKGAVQKYENGQIRNFKADTIKKLTEYFKVPPAHFIYDLNEIPDYGKDAIEVFLELYFGERASRFMKNVNSMNDDGLHKLGEYADDIALIDKYKKSPD